MIAIRPGEPADSRACFALFRRSLWDLMKRTGYLPADDPGPDIAPLWLSYVGLFEHLARSYAQWWVAEDSDGQLLGYARSTLRGETLELTEFFVAPGARVSGLGRALLERAFPVGLGSHRAIIATVDAPAVALYLRFGVAHQTTGVDMTGSPREIDLPAGYDVRAVGDARELVGLEGELLGHARPEDLRYMLGDRDALILCRDGASVGYMFLPNENGYAGPVGVLDPADMPAALAYVEHAAWSAGMQRLDLTVPLAARSAVAWLLGERGFRIDPFYCLYLADGPWARLDRYLPFNPCVIL